MTIRFWIDGACPHWCIGYRFNFRRIEFIRYIQEPRIKYGLTLLWSFQQFCRNEWWRWQIFIFVFDQPIDFSEERLRLGSRTRNNYLQQQYGRILQAFPPTPKCPGNTFLAYKKALWCPTKTGKFWNISLTSEEPKNSFPGSAKCAGDRWYWKPKTFRTQNGYKALVSAG